MATEAWKGKWKIIRDLSAGGQGTTHVVESVTELGRRGVMKLLKHDTDEKARGRMAREATNLATLYQEKVKVPQLLDHNTAEFKESSVQLYLVMEFVPGETLDKCLEAKGNRLSLEHSIAIARDLSQTMEAMHQRDVLHRDLKPANLMVRDFEKADIVVLDLGLSFNRTATDETVTGSSETIKNELFALPEGLTPGGNRRDPRSDITNIVGVFFFCLTGNLPRSFRNERNLPPHKWNGLGMNEILASDSRWQQVEFLFDTGFAADIEDRFRTIKELQDRFSLILKPVRSAKKDPV